MIRYTLRCEKNHEFESWFASSSAYEAQARRELVTCPFCGSARVEKAIMAPAIQRKGRSRKEVPAAAEEPRGAPTEGAPAPVAMISPEETELRGKLRELRDHLTKNADYVGTRFPEEARRMHYGETEHRSIYGEASLDQAQDLADEGIPFHPLPILPDDRN